LLLQIEVPLSKLKPDPANVRKTDVEPSKQFIASVREEGILEALTIRPNGEGYLVTNGGKRLAALTILLKDKAIDADYLVPCVLRDGDNKAARNISLAVNYMREDMHPVDEYEAFADLVKDGMTPEEIRRKYGLTKQGVDQVLALGQLAPEIRKAWRDGKIGEDAARAFTLETDQKRQAEVLKKLSKHHGLHAWNVKNAIRGDERQARSMVNFVGLDVYKAAGGATAQDLFADDDDPAVFATDLVLLKKLYDEKLKGKKAELEAEGWKWVEFQADLPHSAMWWNSKPKKDVKSEDRGKFGVIIAKGHDGEITVKFGVQKPAEQKATERKAKSAAGGLAVAISSALCERLTKQMTEAAAAVLEHDGNLALVTVCAALTSMSHDGSIDVRGSMVGTAKFVTQFELMRKKSVAELHGVLASVAADCLSIGGAVQDRLPLSKNRPGDRALLEALDAKKLNAELRKNFDAADYFKGVTAQACKDAIALCDPKYPFTGKEKKSDLAKVAADLVKKSNASGKAGYLPPEMRTAYYDGPASASKGAKSKSTKKKAA